MMERHSFCTERPRALTIVLLAVSLLSPGSLLAVDGELRIVTAGGEERDPVLASARKLCHDHDVEWESVRIDAEPADAVSEAVRRWDADCLFMGAFGHGRLHDLLLGSHTEEILEAVRVPTFLVR